MELLVLNVNTIILVGNGHILDIAAVLATPLQDIARIGVHIVAVIRHKCHRAFSIEDMRLIAIETLRILIAIEVVSACVIGRMERIIRDVSKAELQLVHHLVWHVISLREIDNLVATLLWELDVKGLRALEVSLIISGATDIVDGERIRRNLLARGFVQPIVELGSRLIVWRSRQSHVVTYLIADLG